MIWYVQSYRLLLHNCEKGKTKRAQTARLYKIDELDSEADEVAPNANHTNVADVCGRLKEYNAQFKIGRAHV